MNTTLVQSQMPCSVAPLLAIRLKTILSRDDLKNLLALQQKFDAIYAERSEFAKAPALMDEARRDLHMERTEENKVRFNELLAKYHSDDHCRAARDMCDDQLRELSTQTPAAVKVVLRRVQIALGEAYREHCAHEAQSFAMVGIKFEPEVNGGEVINFIKLQEHQLGLTLTAIKRGRRICAEDPDGVLAPYLFVAPAKKDDLESFLYRIKKENLSPTLPVPHEEPEPVVAVSPREQAWRDSIDAPSVLIDRATSKPVKPALPGVDFPQYAGLRPEGISSDGSFSQELGRIAALPSRV